MNTAGATTNTFFDPWLNMMSDFNRTWSKTSNYDLKITKQTDWKLVVQEYAGAIDKTWHNFLQNIPENPLLSLNSSNLFQSYPVTEQLLAFLDYSNRMVFQFTENMISNHIQAAANRANYQQLARVLLPGMDAEWYAKIRKETKQMFWPFYQLNELEKPEDESLQSILEYSVRFLNRINRLQFLAASSSLRALLRTISEFQNKSRDENNNVVLFYDNWTVINDKEFCRLFNGSEFFEHQEELRKLAGQMSKICRKQTDLFFNQFAHAVRTETEISATPRNNRHLEKRVVKIKQKATV